MAIRKIGKHYQIDYYDPNGKRIRQNFKMKKDAVAELGKRVSLMTEGRYMDQKREYTTTMKELIEKYKEIYGFQASFKNAKKTYTKNYEDYFKPDKIVSTIRYVDLETYRNYLREKFTPAGRLRAVASINREMSCLHHMLSKAVDWDMVEQSPFDKGKSLILKENNQRLRYLDQDEIDQLLEACSTKVIEFPNSKNHVKKMTRSDTHYLRDIVETAINSGMRKGEILSLKWAQIKNGLIYLTETKTTEPRQIPINDDLTDVFKRIRKRQGVGSKYVFIFQGKPIGNTKTGFKEAVKRAGLDDFRFHDLRHTFASQLIMRGGSLKEVQELLGHKTMTMTMRYAHLSQDHKKKAVNLLNGLTASKRKNNFSHKLVTVSKEAKSAGV